MSGLQQDEIRHEVLAILHRYAPEADLSTLRQDANLRRELDLDSIDALNVLTEVHKRFAVDIPQTDYGRLENLSDLIKYVMEKMTERQDKHSEI